MISRTLLRQSRAGASSLSRPASLSQSFRRSQPVFRAPFAAIPRRHYADAKGGVTPEKPTTIDDVGETKAAADQGADAGKSEIEKKDKEIVDLKDKYLRSVAEFRNLQERTKREVQTAKDFAIQRFAKDLMESIDNFDRAFEAVPAEALESSRNSASQKDLATFYDGLRMTETILMTTLKKHGLERFDPSVDGEKFNPNMHDAIFQAPMPGKTPGTVFNTQQKGFTLNGRVLRAAKVGIVKEAE